MTSSGARKRWLTLGVAAALCASLVDRADAQRFGRGPTPGAGACFYEDPDFGGEYFCIRAGDRVDEMPRDMNDRISSIRTFGHVEVTVFQDRDFSGRAARFENVQNLKRQGWNDRISSIRVEGFGGGLSQLNELTAGRPFEIGVKARPGIATLDPQFRVFRVFRGQPRSLTAIPPRPTVPAPLNGRFP